MGRCSQRFRFKRTQICKPTQRQSITISPFKLPKKLWRKMVSGTWRLPWCLERRKRNRPHDPTLDSPSTEPLHFVRMFLRRSDRELFGLTGEVCSFQRYGRCWVRSPRAQRMDRWNWPFLILGFFLRKPQRGRQPSRRDLACSRTLFSRSGGWRPFEKRGVLFPEGSVKGRHARRAFQTER